MSSDNMACDMAQNVDVLEELEVTESDAALLRELLEELESEDQRNEESCVIMESAVDQSEASVDLFRDHVMAEDQHPRYSSHVDDADWIDLLEVSSMLQSANDVAVSDWLGGNNAVGIVGFEHCNNVGDYSYMYNEMAYTRLWEDES